MMRYILNGAALFTVGILLVGCTKDESKAVASKQVIVKAPGMT